MQGAPRAVSRRASAVGRGSRRLGKGSPAQVSEIARLPRSSLKPKAWFCSLVAPVRLLDFEDPLRQISVPPRATFPRSLAMFGTVVVGVGIAGSVRIRDLLNPLPSSPAEHLKLVGFVSRRPLSDVQQANQISLQEALDSQEVHAAIISTDNKNHEESIRMFLDAGKHVLVEYPMALSAKAAHQLWEMADQKGKVLHVEHIELLTEEYKQLKKEVEGKELVKGTLHFTGGPLDEERSGFPAFSGIARLTWLVDLFGDLTVVSAAREEQKEKNYSRMTVQFQTANKRSLTWIEERAPGLKRDKTINFCFKSGCLESLPEAPRAAVGLFMQDLVLFAKKLLGQVSKDELAAEKQRILRCLDLADEIQTHCEQTPKIYSGNL